MGHQKSNNPYRQQYQLLKARDNVYQSKINKMHSDFKAELMKSHAYAGLAQQYTVDQTLQPGTFSGSKLVAHTDVAKKAKLSDKSPAPLSKVLQGISPVLVETNRKKASLPEHMSAAATALANKNSVGLPPSSSSSLLQGFPLALQQEVRAYHQHHSNFSFMLKQTMNSGQKDKTETPKNDGQPQLHHLDNVPEFPATEPSRDDDLKAAEAAKQSFEQEYDNARAGGLIEVTTAKHDLIKPPDRSHLDSKKNSYMNVLQQNHSNDARSRIMPLNAQYPQFGTLLPLNQRAGAGKLTDKKTINKKVLPLQGLHSLNKMSNQISQRSLRVDSESRMKKVMGANAKLDR